MSPPGQKELTKAKFASRELHALVRIHTRIVQEKEQGPVWIQLLHLLLRKRRCKSRNQTGPKKGGTADPVRADPFVLAAAALALVCFLLSYATPVRASFGAVKCRSQGSSTAVL